MKKLLTYICMLAFAAPFTSCEKEIMNYEGVDGLYFDVRWGKEFRDPSQWAHQYYTPVRVRCNDRRSLLRTIACSYQRYNQRLRPSVQHYYRKSSTDAVAGRDYVDFAKAM